MAYTVVSGFPSGVDRTREIFCAPAGTLWSGINGHLSRGGDFEVRKAFVAKHTLPPGTFGMVASPPSLVVFGSAAPPVVPTGVTYQRLQHPDGLAMTRLRSSDLFNGKVYAVAEYSDGSVHHFYDGAIVSDWVNGVVRAGFTNLDGIAAHLATLIAADSAYTVSVAGAVITVTAAVAGTPFTMSAYTENVTGGMTQAITIATVTSNVAGVAEVRARASFQVVAGTSNPGTNRVTSVKINGIEIMNVAVNWTSSHSATASLIADQINTYASSPEYTATASGATVTITAATGTGAGPNGFVLSVTVGGDVQVGSVQNMAGGVAAVTGIAQVQTATLSGAFEIGDRFGITIDGKKFGAEGAPYPAGTVVRTHQRKVYAGGFRIVNFSGLDTPAGWRRDQYAGAGFVNASNQEGTARQVTGLGKYLNNLAVAFETSMQIWFMDKDDAVNTLVQEIGEIGTRSPRSMVNFGTLDLFFLAETGVRSVRSRDQVNLAGVNDVGTPIDALVQEARNALTAQQVSECCAVVDPESGRYWLAVGPKVFVFSYFPSKKISGWTWYEPGVSFTDWAVLERRVYGRAGDVIYLYGGDSGVQYGADYTAEVVLPFQEFGRPAHRKEMTGVEVSVVGAWDVDLLVNPNDVNDVVHVGTIDSVTWAEEQVAAMASTTHAGMRLRRSAASGGKVCQSAIHYMMGEA